MQKIFVVFMTIVICFLFYFTTQKNKNQKIRKLLSDENSLKVLQTYDELAVDERVSLKDLISVLREGNENERYGVLAVLRRMGTKSAPAIPDIILALQDTSSTVRRGAANCLGGLEQKASEALPKLVSTLDDPVSGVRLDAAISYWKISRDAAISVPMITNAVSSVQDKTDLKKAIKILEEIGLEAGNATGFLLYWSTNSSIDVRFAACAALVAVNPKLDATAPTVFGIIKEDKYYWSAGVDLLAIQSGNSSQAWEALKLLELDQNPKLRQLAIAAVKNSRAIKSN